MLSVMVLLVLIAGALTIWSAMGKGPLWPAVFVIVLIEALHVLPR